MKSLADYVNMVVEIQRNICRWLNVNGEAFNLEKIKPYGRLSVLLGDEAFGVKSC